MTINSEDLLIELPLDGTLAEKPNNDHPVSTFGNVAFVTDNTSVFEKSMQCIGSGGLKVENMGTPYERTTYMMWIKTQGSRVGLMGFGGNVYSTPIFNWYFHTNIRRESHIKIYLYIPSMWPNQIPSVMVMSASLTEPINDGHWHHLAISSNSITKVLNLFVDGKLISSVTFARTINNNKLPLLYVGLSQSVNTAGMDKEFAYFKVYTTDLSSEQIRGIMLSDQRIKPQIDSLSQTSVRYRASLTIEGSDFSEIPSENTVTFGGGKTALATSATETMLTVTIPFGAESGPITVTRLGIVSNKSSMSLTIIPNPIISSLSTMVSTIGRVISINGSYFSTTPSENRVNFPGGAVAVASSATETSLTVTIPDGARSGTISVTSDGADSNNSADTLTIMSLPTVKRCENQSTSDLRDVNNSSDGFIAVGNSGTILASDMTANTWKQVGDLSDPNLKEFPRLNGIVYTGDQYVAVGQSLSTRSHFFYSPDKTNWFSKGWDVMETITNGIVAHNNFIYTVSRSFVSRAYVSAKSIEDLISFRIEGSTSLQLTTIANSANTIVCSGANTSFAKISDFDGEKSPFSRPISVSHTVLALTYCDHLGKFVALCSGGSSITSNDGETWSAQHPLNARGKDFYGLTWDNTNKRFYAVGHHGLIEQSPDGENWLSVPSGSTSTLKAIICNNGTCVAVGSGGEILKITVESTKVDQG